MTNVQALFAVGVTIVATTYCHLALKWHVSSAGPMPTEFIDRVTFLVKILLNPLVISAFAAAFVAALAWLVAMTRLPLSYAYPFVSATFPMILLFSSLLFGETITWQKLVGVTMIVGGIVVHSQG